MKIIIKIIVERERERERAKTIVCNVRKNQFRKNELIFVEKIALIVDFLKIQVHFLKPAPTAPVIKEPSVRIVDKRLATKIMKLTLNILAN